MKALVITMVAMIALPAAAQGLTPERRAQLEAEIAAGEARQREIDRRNRRLDQAYYFARGVDTGIGVVAGQVAGPAGSVTYRASRRASDALIRRFRNGDK